jgi:hypothetical protein
VRWGAHEPRNTMFSLKELLDGLVEDILELPAMWVRTHFLVLSDGARAPFLISRAAKRDKGRFLTLRTAAFLDFLVLYALVQGINAPVGKFSDSFLGTILQPDKLNITDPTFLKLLIMFLAFYYAFYLLITALPLSLLAKRVLIGSCLLYSVLCVAFFFGAFLIFFGPNLGPLSNDILYRTVIYLFDTVVFWQIGAMLYSRLHLRRHFAKRSLAIACCGLMCFLLYLLVTFISSGREGIWPNLNA